MSKGTPHRPIRIDDETWARAQAKAARLGTTASAKARELLREWVEGNALAAAWAEGATVGFDVTREGFNGECAFDHCADEDYPPTNPYSGEKWKAY